MTTNYHPLNGAQGRVPLVTAAGVFAVLLAQSVVSAIVGILAFGLQSGSPFQGFGYSLLIEFLPVGIGVFVSLRYVAPIGAANSLLSTVLRSAVALGAGVVIVFIVALIVTQSFRPNGPLFGDSFPGLSLGGLPQAFYSAIGVFVQLIPLAVLAGILQRLWLAKHPVRAEAQQTAVSSSN
jgi:hypothetical protein